MELQTSDLKIRYKSFEQSYQLYAPYTRSIGKHLSHNIIQPAVNPLKPAMSEN